MKNSIITVTFLLLSFVLTQTGGAQIEKLSGGGEKPSAELVPQNACIAAAVFPEQITSNEILKLFPHEIVTAWGKKELGFDPMLIKQATWVMREPESLNAPPAWAAVLHFEEMQGLAGAMIDDLKEKRIAGKAVFSANSPEHQPGFMVVDEATIVIGMESFFEDMLVKPGGKVTKFFGDPSVAGQAFGFVDVKMLRPTFDEMIEQAGDYDLAPPLERLKKVPDLLESILAGLETKSDLEGTIVLRANSESDGEELNEIIIDAMEYGKVYLLAQMSGQLDLNDPVQAAMIQYAKRMAEKYEKILAPTVDGKELTIKVPKQAMTSLPYLISMFGSLGFVVDVPVDGATTRVTPDNQLRMTALAFHNYAAANLHFPSRVLKDEKGKMLFSGRVSMLPFIEQNNLFNSLRMDEPWDSEHNSQFTSMHISTFGMTDEGLSTLRFPVFPGSLWANDDAELDFADVSDGTANTIFAILAPPEAAINWADPTPWKISPTNPMKDVFGDRDEVIVAMLDASTRVLKKADMTNEKLKALLTISGGETIEK